MIKGQPGSKQSKYAKKLAEHYNIPHIKIKDLLKQAPEIVIP